MRIYTVGHSTRAGTEFLALLRSFGIRRLVDVRRYPGSRRLPHFSRQQLSSLLASVGIEYVHAPALGGRRSPTPASPNDAWRSASFRAYADHMSSSEFRACLDRLAAWAPGEDTVIMCAEAVPWRCHRQLIADALLSRGVAVSHIVADDRVLEHELNPNAVVGADGTLTYPGKLDHWQ